MDDNVQINTTNGSSDPFGHGTHVAGIIGADAPSDQHDGTAPGAVIYSVRVLDDQGQGLTSDVIAGLDWVLANADAQNADRVDDLSLGKAIEESAATDPLVQAVEEVWDAGIVVVASAGNYGRDGYSLSTTRLGSSTFSFAPFAIGAIRRLPGAKRSGFK